MMPKQPLSTNMSGHLRMVLIMVTWLFAHASQAQPSNSQDWRYTIRPQDTVFGISQKYLKPSINWQTLANYNRLPNPQAIHPGSQLRIPLRWLAIRQAQAKLTDISGDVQIKGLDGIWQVARQGQMLEAGQSVQVGRNSSAKLRFADESDLIIQPQSHVSLDTLSTYAGGFMVDTQLRLQSGRVEVTANPLGRLRQKFEVVTPSAVAAVRGTQFIVQAEIHRTIELTTEGNVALQTRQGSVVVPAGFASAANIGERPNPPEVIKPAPALQIPTPLFTDFPIVFSLVTQPNVSGWVMQVGQDPQMAQLVLTQQSASPHLDAAGLPDGIFYMRAWSLDAQGIPSKVTQHTFEVDIPRQLHGPVIPLPPSYFASGPVNLQLSSLPIGQRYFVQMTQDAEGRLPVWHLHNANAILTLPIPEERNRLHYLWIWVY